MDADQIIAQLEYLAANSRSKHDVLIAAVDLIKSQQTELDASKKRDRFFKDTINKQQIELDAAVKCITDIETYLGSDNTKYIKGTIDNWRGHQEAGKGESDGTE